jgi:hypothetical protein
VKDRTTDLMAGSDARFSDVLDCIGAVFCVTGAVSLEAGT